MTFEELRDQVRTNINRKDATDTLINSWINMAITRITRLLRLPNMEALHTVTVATTAADTITVPDDYLSLIAIYVDGRKLRKVTLQQIVEDDSTLEGEPEVYCRIQNEWHIRPYASVDTVIKVLYYQDHATLDTDDEETTLTQIASDLITWGALIYGAVWANDERRELWKAEFNEMVEEFRLHAIEEEFGGGEMQVQSAYGLDE